jgi:hypothetical protein
MERDSRFDHQARRFLRGALTDIGAAAIRLGGQRIVLAWVHAFEHSKGSADWWDKANAYLSSALPDPRTTQSTPSAPPRGCGSDSAHKKATNPTDTRQMATRPCNLLREARGTSRGGVARRYGGVPTAATGRGHQTHRQAAESTHIAVTATDAAQT